MLFGTVAVPRFVADALFGTAAASAQCTGRVMRNKDQSSESFLVAGELLGEVRE